jgi:hypothetical protein
VLNKSWISPVLEASRKLPHNAGPLLDLAEQ